MTRGNLRLAERLVQNHEVSVLPRIDGQGEVRKQFGFACFHVLLAKLLQVGGNVLLLDEPTNHLDAESVAWLERFLHDFEGTVVAITHDRYFLDNVVGWVLELDRGRSIPFEGNYSGWLEAKSERLAQEFKQQSAHEKAMKEELEWVRKNAKGRQAKSKARLARFEELSDVEYQKRNETNEIFIPVAERLGDQVIEFQNVSKAYGDRLLIDNLSMIIPPGAIVGIIGPNGAGKSTLFRMITGEEQPDEGQVATDRGITIGYFSQDVGEMAGRSAVAPPTRPCAPTASAPGCSGTSRPCPGTGPSSSSPASTTTRRVSLLPTPLVARSRSPPSTSPACTPSS